jgi:hypothetical protein
VKGKITVLPLFRVREKFIDNLGIGLALAGKKSCSVEFDLSDPTLAINLMLLK